MDIEGVVFVIIDKIRIKEIEKTFNNIRSGIKIRELYR